MPHELKLMVAIGIESDRSCEYQVLPAANCDTNSHNALVIKLKSKFAPNVPPSTPFCKGEYEVRSLEFFQLRSLHVFNDTFPDDFWNITILQLAQIEPAIQHAVLALSAYHEGEHEIFALNQFNLAIRALLHPSAASQPLSKELQVVSCLIFFNIEVGYSWNNL